MKPEMADLNQLVTAWRLQHDKRFSGRGSDIGCAYHWKPGKRERAEQEWAASVVENDRFAKMTDDEWLAFCTKRFGKEA